jgi:hypothetical protein
MKKFTSIRAAISGLTLSVVLLATSAGSAFAAPSPDSKRATTPPSTSFSSGPQTQAPVEPGTVDAEKTDKLGDTSEAKVDKEGKLEASANGVAPLAGNVANVDFQTPYNYCYKNLVYTPVKNSTSTTKYVRVMLYNQGGYRDMYATVAAGATSYPAFYGVEGNYTAYLYVWNGSSYQYDEYLSNNNTCNVSVTRTYNSSGWVQLKIQNLGTAYATQKSTELAPFAGSGTYTGNHYDYPTAGGAAIYRWFWVSTSPYGIVSDTLNSTTSPTYFSGDL